MKAKKRKIAALIAIVLFLVELLLMPANKASACTSEETEDTEERVVFYILKKGQGIPDSFEYDTYLQYCGIVLDDTIVGIGDTFCYDEVPVFVDGADIQELLCKDFPVPTIEQLRSAGFALNKGDAIVFYLLRKAQCGWHLVGIKLVPVLDDLEEPTKEPPEPTNQPPEPTKEPPEPTQQPPEPTQQPPEPTKQPPEPTKQPPQNTTPVPTATVPTPEEESQVPIVEPLEEPIKEEPEEEEPVIDEDTEEIPEEEVGEEVPKGVDDVQVDKLPQTGTADPSVFFLSGVNLIAIGLYIFKKKLIRYR